MTGLSVPGQFALRRNHVRLWHIADILELSRMSAPRGLKATSPGHRRFSIMSTRGLKQCNRTEWLFDHLVGTGEQRWRHGYAEGLGCLEVDDQLELCRLFYRQIGRFRPFQDFIHETGSAMKLVSPIHAICYKAAMIRIFLQVDVDGRPFLAASSASRCRFPANNGSGMMMRASECAAIAFWKAFSKPFGPVTGSD